MGQALSCLKPEAQEFQVSSKPNGKREEAADDALVSSKGVNNHDTALPVSGTTAGAAREPISLKKATPADDAPLVPQRPHPASDAKTALGLRPAVAILDAPLRLDSDALTGTGSGSLQQSSPHPSSQGYPYSSYELGPPRPETELARLQAMRALDIFDSISAGRKSRLDEEADMVLSSLMQMFRAATAMLVLFEESRIVIRNAKGFMDAGEFPYRWSFCAYTTSKQRPQTLIVPDATNDMRFADNPFVRGAPGIRFYCGAPLVSASGHVLGTLCFADTSPRPGFDAGQCCLANNMAEVMVRQLERFRANAGPAGPVDAETTALARVARTAECYEAVTGLVDISLPEGWMMMYVNEAWGALCSPWTRKQLLGRPLQRLLVLEPGSKFGSEQDPESAGNSLPRPQQQRKADGQQRGLTPLTVAERRQWRERLEKQQQGLRGAQAQPDEDAQGSSGVPEDGGGASAPSVPSRGVWRRFAGALRAGEEVEMGRARLLMEDGQPSTSLVRVHVRPANCHVLDAATRMPVGVPPQLALPASILGAAKPSFTAGTSGVSRAQQGVDLVKAGGGEGSVAAAPAGPADTPAEMEPESVPDAPEQPEPYYCFVTLSLIRDGEGEDPGASDCGSAGTSGAEVGLSGRGSRRSNAAQDVGRHKSGAGSWGAGAGAAMAPANSGTSNLWPYAGGYELPSRLACRPTGRPSQDATGSNANAVTAGGAGSRLGGRPSLDNAASGALPSDGGGAGGDGRRPSLDTGTGTGNTAAVHRLGRAPSQAATADSSAVASGSSYRAGTMTATATGGTRLQTGMSDVQSIASWTYGMEPVPGLRLGHMLGKGGYGRVFTASYKGQRVAAKVISNSMLKNASCVNGVTLEALLAQEIEHPYIVRTYKCVVRSYLPNGLPSLSELGYYGRAAASNTAGSTAAAAARNSSAWGHNRGGVAPSPTPAPSGVLQLPNGVSCRSETVTQTVEEEVASGDGAGKAGGTAGGVNDGAIPEERTTRPDDFDSFDAGGDEGAGGMIDQLVSGPGPAPAHAPSHAPSYPYPPSQAPSYNPSHAGMPSRLSVSTGSFAQRSAIGAGAAAALTATADTDQLAVALCSPGAPPRLPSNAGGPAPASTDMYGNPGGAGGSVFDRDAAAAAAAYHPGTAASDALPDGETWILQEFCTGGTLQDAIDTGRLRTEPSRLRGQPHLPAILVTAQEVASAMHCLHSRGYMHGDLSAVNVLLTEPPGGPGATPRGWVAKVSDFGLAKHLPDPNRPFVSSAYGVITHCAPEVLKAHMQTPKADVYSFGVLLWQMWTGARPWANMNRFQILGTVTSATSPGLRFLPNQQPPDRYRNLTLRCLSYDPAVRPTFAEVCEELRMMTLEQAAVAVGIAKVEPGQ